jgi:adenylate kinase family enzyme
MKKIIIIGPSGAGKSTFARKLRDVTGLPLYYLDMLWHRPDRTTVSREEFDERLLEILREDSWIIDGNFARTLEMRMEFCDTVFLLDYPVDVCLSGVESRIGTKREDMPWIENEFDPEFKKWILDFPEKTMPSIYEKLKRCGNGKNIIIFRSRGEAADYLENLRAEINGTDM